MRQMKKALCAVLAILMLLTMFAGCGKKSSSSERVVTGDGLYVNEYGWEISHINEYGWEVPMETLDIRVSNLSGYYAPDEDAKAGFENMKQYLLDKFNVNLIVDCVTGDGTEAANLALASGDYGDVVTGIGLSTAQKFQSQGRAVELGQYMDNIGSEIRGRLSDIVYNMISDEDGNVYFLPRSTGAIEELPDYSAAIRYDEWLALGSPKFETPEEYYDVLKQILAENPTNADGEKRYALSFSGGDWPLIVGGYWGLRNGWEVNDDTYDFTYWAFSDRGYEMTQFFNTVYREGNLDPDAFINDMAEWGTKFSSERIAGNIGYWWQVYTYGHEVWTQTDENLDPNKRFVQVGFKSANVDTAYVTGKNHMGSTFTLITDKCENPEMVMKFLNFQATDLGMALFNWGIPNGVQDIDDPSSTIISWTLDEEGNWEFLDEAKEAFLNDTWNYTKEEQLGATSGEYLLFRTVSRWDDGIYCVWPNQCWYEENKWKSMMIENLDGTIYDSTAMKILNTSAELTMMEAAVRDAWYQYWPVCVQSNSDAELEANWKTLQNALTSAGIEQLTEIYQENYKDNLGV